MMMMLTMTMLRMIFNANEYAQVLLTAGLGSMGSSASSSSGIGYWGIIRCTSFTKSWVLKYELWEKKALRLLEISLVVSPFPMKLRDKPAHASGIVVNLSEKIFIVALRIIVTAYQIFQVCLQLFSAHRSLLGRKSVRRKERKKKRGGGVRKRL